MEAARDFNDWEMILKPDLNPYPAPASSETWSDFQRIGSDSEDVMRSDYFSIRPENKAMEKDTEMGLIESCNSSPGDPSPNRGSTDGTKIEVGLEGNGISSGNSGRFSSKSGGDGLVARKFGDFEVRGELGTGDDVKREANFDGIELSGGKLSGNRSVEWKFEGFEGKSELGFGDDVKREELSEGTGAIEGGNGEFWSDMSSDDGMVFEEKNACDGKSELDHKNNGKENADFEGIGIEHEKKDESLLDSGRGGLTAGEFGGFDGEIGTVNSDFPKTEDALQSAGGAGVGAAADSVESAERDGRVPASVENAAVVEVKLAKGGEKKAMVWWKLPLELLKFCAFRISPVWSLSIAAAMVGIVILRRRLQKRKRMSRSIPLNVSVDEKKVSQVMVRVSRLNEAFSVVRRIPIVRSSLPPVNGVTPWPTMSLR